jgi:hypothetical protein
MSLWAGVFHVAGDLNSLEPAYSNLIDYFDMKGVKTSVKFIAECVRYAKGRGMDDKQVEATFLSCVGAIADRPLVGEEMEAVKEKFVETVNRGA